MHFHPQGIWTTPEAVRKAPRVYKWGHGRRDDTVRGDLLFEYASVCVNMMISEGACLLWSAIVGTSSFHLGNLSLEIILLCIWFPWHRLSQQASIYPVHCVVATDLCVRVLATFWEVVIVLLRHTWFRGVSNLMWTWVLVLDDPTFINVNVNERYWPPREMKMIYFFAFQNCIM